MKRREKLCDICGEDITDSLAAVEPYMIFREYYCDTCQTGFPADEKEERLPNSRPYNRQAKTDGSQH